MPLRYPLPGAFALLVFYRKVAKTSSGINRKSLKINALSIFLNAFEAQALDVVASPLSYIIPYDKRALDYRHPNVSELVARMHEEPERLILVTGPRQDRKDDSRASGLERSQTTPPLCRRG